MNNKQALFDKIDGSTTFRNICDVFGLRSKRVLDIGCGHGQYLKHFGTGSVGVTTAEDEVMFGKESGLSIVIGNAERLDPPIGKGFKAIWANNIFEHLLSPHAFLMNLKKVSEKDSLIIIGVPMVPKLVSLTRLRQWAGPLASNHVNFFTHTTFRLTVERAGWDVITVRPFVFKNTFLDILVRPLAPHVYVVAKNNPNFKYPEKKVHEWMDDAHYSELLTITGQK